MTNDDSTHAPSNVEAFSLRLKAGEDIRRRLTQTANQFPIDAGCVASAVGSLTHANIRLAGSSDGFRLAGPLEVLSINGTVGSGGVHLHMMVSDSSGKCVGGHILEGCVVNTTLELVILKLADHQFDRIADPSTGFLELKIRNKKQED